MSRSVSTPTNCPSRITPSAPMSRSSINRAHCATGVATSTTTGYGVMSCLTVTAIAGVFITPPSGNPLRRSGLTGADC